MSHKEPVQRTRMPGRAASMEPDSALMRSMERLLFSMGGAGIMAASTISASGLGPARAGSPRKGLCGLTGSVTSGSPSLLSLSWSLSQSPTTTPGNPGGDVMISDAALVFLGSSTVGLTLLIALFSAIFIALPTNDTTSNQAGRLIHIIPKGWRMT